MRRIVISAIDLLCVGAAPFVALLLRENFESSTAAIMAVQPYAGISVVVAALTFGVAGLNRDIWSYASLPEVLRILAATIVAILLSLAATFVFNRLEGVARSLPVIQWFVLVSGMIGVRVATRLLRSRLGREKDTRRQGERGAEHVLIVGLNRVTELYLRSVTDFASERISIVGILAAGEFRGRLIQFHKIIGAPEELPRILAKYEVHGIAITRIVITEPLDQLSEQARETILQTERETGIALDFFAERIGLFEDREHLRTPQPASPTQATLLASERTVKPPYVRVKRMLDIAGALLLTIALLPVAAVVALLVVVDVGLPLTFWQQRPGYRGRPFKLHKFRTMREAHDGYGNRIPDDDRQSGLGRFLRRTRLDELPQLYNILAGDMSFVGPRPLLAADLAPNATVRLSVRPGVTGWAQVNGGRIISIEDKDSLDQWYVRNMSFWLDVKIVLRTFAVVVKGERLNDMALRLARENTPVAPADTG